MKFISLQINTKKEGEKTFIFSEKTQIFSIDNSVGKSTLLRLLFYSLGYPIPSTIKFKFNYTTTTLRYIINDTLYKIIRSDKQIALYSGNDKIESLELNNSNLQNWLSLVWQVASPYVVNNLLGAIYLDQDKGWTLLNRGTVIGSIHFNIRDLLIGLSSNSNQNIYQKLSKLNELKQLRKETSAVLKLNEFSKDRSEKNVSVKNSTDNELEKEFESLQLSRSVLDKKIQRLKRQINNEKTVLNYIDSLHLLISYKEEKIPVTKDNLFISKNNIEFLIQQLSYLENELINLNYKIDKIKYKLSKNTSTFFKETDPVDLIMDSINEMNINVYTLEKRVNELDNKISKLNKDIELLFIKDNELIESTEKWINIFAKELNILDIVNKNKYLFTRDLKSISGTIYYKVVFAFKMAYIKVIESVTKEKLPIVLDSPGGREVTERNLDIVVDILNKYFKNNQIIIASIKDYKISGLIKLKINKRLME